MTNLNRWKLSKSIYADNKDNVTLFGDRKSVTDNVIANIKSIDDASFLIIDIGSDIYDSTKNALKENGISVHRFEPSSPYSEGYDISKTVKSGNYWKLPEYLFYENELNRMITDEKEKSSLKINQYRLLYCIYECLYTEGDSFELSRMLPLLEMIADKKSAREKLKPFHEYDDKYNNHTPVTEILKKLDKLSDGDLNAIIISLYMRLSEFSAKRSKELFTGTLGLESILEKKTATFINLNEFQSSLTEQVVLFSILSRLCDIKREYLRQNKNCLPLYVVVNMSERNANVPWSELERLRSFNDLYSIVTIKSNYQNENDIYWHDKYIGRFCSGNFAVFKAFGEEDASLLSHRGGYKDITKRHLFKKETMSVPAVSMRSILYMSDNEVFVINKDRKLSAIDERI